MAEFDVEVRLKLKVRTTGGITDAAGSVGEALRKLKQQWDWSDYDITVVDWTEMEVRVK